MPPINTFPPHRILRLWTLTALTCAVLSGAGAANAASVHVLASHLNQPKKLTIAANGALVVALSGNGSAPSSCTSGTQASCAGRSGEIAAVSPSGSVVPLLTGLSSVSSGTSEGDQATGPVQAIIDGGRLHVLFQGSVINARTGTQVFGGEGDQLEKLLTFSGSSNTLSADFGVYEARHNPDHGAGTDVRYGDDVAIDSDPYAIVAYRRGYAIADAGANDVLYVSPAGRVSVLAVLPTIRERAAASTYGTTQKQAIWAQAQPVPDALAVGPDGALYVGELTGMPNATGAADVYRVLPGHRTTVYARGFSAISDIAFDRQGRLLVLEIDRKGLADAGFQTGKPASGAVIRIAAGRRTTLLSSGLSYPTGLAVGATGVIYVSNNGVSSAGTGHGGEILAIAP